MQYELIEAETFPKAWEKALKMCWNKGIEVRTELEKELDPPSRDFTAMIAVENPKKEPRFHRAGFPMGAEDLISYMEDFISPLRSRDGQAKEDTYSNRIIGYKAKYEEEGAEELEKPEETGVDQLEYMLEELERDKTSKKAQAVLWNPKIDPGNYKTSPDLIRVWARIVQDELNMNVYMCSNDLFKATFSNMMAFFQLQELLAEKLEVKVGSYCHIADSLHINGAYHEEVENTLEELRHRDWEEKTWTTEDINKFS